MPTALRYFLLFMLTVHASAVAYANESVRVATFDIDATPPVGSSMAYNDVKRIGELSLRCRGIVLTGAGQPIVLCAVDWIGIANEGYDAFRDGLAAAAGTTRERVAVHALHQHDAPGCDFTAEKIVKELGLKGYARFDGTFHREVIQRASDAIRAALPHAQPATHYGWGEAEVKKVASNRRILGPDWMVRAVRFTTTRDPKLRAEPEGVIDPAVSLLSFWNGNKPLAVLSYYACHPQSYYRTGIPSPDFPGIARFIRGQGVPEALHVHFNGAGGNIGAGKYNDGNRENRMILAQRLADGMRDAWTTTEKWPLRADAVHWAVEPVQLPPADHLDEEKMIAALKNEPARGYIAKADQLAWLRRCQAGHKIDITALRVGRTQILHMPGELFVEYQLAAKKMRPDLHVAMAAYGEYGPGYIGTEVAYSRGGYETGSKASAVAPGSEKILHQAMRKLLGEAPALENRVPPTAANDAPASFEVPEGFEMQLVAAEPQVCEPIVITYDENGCLYVAEYLKFPSHNGKSDGPDGRIRRLRDLDGDGHYETSNVFAKDLAWPTGLCPWQGGLFVVSAPDLWYLKDTDGNGEADVREKVFTGFGFRNDEGTANNLTWGIDHWIYGAGSNSGGDIRPVNQPKAAPISLRSRDFRFHPVTREFEALSGSEQFGHAMDDWGNRFLCSNSKPAVHVVLPSRYLSRNPFLPVSKLLQPIWTGNQVHRASPVEAWRSARTKIRLAARPNYAAPFVAHDVFTGCSGITIYRGAAYPPAYRGNLFVGEVQSNLIHRRALHPDGVTFRSERVEQDTEFLRSTDNWFRPANMYNAPDGTLHVVDMYRESIETPDSMPPEILAMVDFHRGHEHGRIYRLAPAGFQPPPPPKLAAASTTELVSELVNPNGWWRDTASRLLFERQDASAEHLLRPLLGIADSAVTRLHALHALAGLDKLKSEDLLRCLDDRAPGIREHALRLVDFASRDAKSKPLREKVIQLADNDNPRVRFQAAFTLGDATGPEVAAALIHIAQRDAGDRWMRTAVRSAHPRLAADLFAAETRQAADEQRPPDGDLLNHLAGIVGRRSVASEVESVLQILAGKTPAATGSQALSRLADGLFQARSNLGAYAEKFPGILELMSGQIAHAKKILANPTTSANQRRQAITTLTQAPYAEVSALFTQLLDSKQPPAIQGAALRALAGYRQPETATALLAAFPNVSPDVRSEVMEVLLSRDAWIAPLLEAVESRRIAPGYIALPRRAHLLKHGNPDLRAKALKLFSGETHPRKQVVASYRPALKLVGDTARGRTLFEQHCLACHTHPGKGPSVGPDLATMKNRAPEALLMQILDPNSELLATYTLYYVELKDGTLASGRIASESPASLTLQRAGGVEETILRENIRRITGSGLSLMPEGLEGVLDHQQMSDLVAFLLEK